MSEHDIPRAHHESSEGFDYSEPKTGAIWAFAVGSVLVLVVTIGALQHYFEEIWNDAVQEKVLAAPNADSNAVRGRDNWDLTHYEYLNKQAGQVRIPLDRARELFMQEIAAGKPFYPGKATAPKPEEPDPGAPAQSGAAQPSAAPAQDAGKK